MSENKIDAVWDVYRINVPLGQDPQDDADIFLRTKIIENYFYLTDMIVGSMKRNMPAHVERDDLKSHASIGLMQAVMRYDHTKGVPFEAYAMQRMRSVIMDAVRDADEAPRSLRKKKRDIDRAEEAIRSEYEREPTAVEVSETLDMSVKEINDVKYRAGIASHTYIEGNLEAQHKEYSSHQALDDDELELVDVLQATVTRAYANLEIRKAAIIALHYFQETKLSTIAKMLNMSEVKVGQLHAEAVMEIWEKVQESLASV